MQQQGLTLGAAGSWWPRLAAFAIAALAAGSAAYWVLKFQKGPALNTAVVVAGAGGPSVTAPDAATLARALGASASNAAQAAQPALEPARVNLLSRMALQGVIASGSKAGTALIAIDGKPARPFRVGNRVDGDLLLQAVTTKQAMLAVSMNGPATATLELTPIRR